MKNWTLEDWILAIACTALLGIILAATFDMPAS